MVFVKAKEAYFKIFTNLLLSLLPVLLGNFR